HFSPSALRAALAPHSLWCGADAASISIGDDLRSTGPEAALAGSPCSAPPSAVLVTVKWRSRRRQSRGSLAMPGVQNPSVSRTADDVDIPTARTNSSLNRLTEPVPFASRKRYRRREARRLLEIIGEI